MCRNCFSRSKQISENQNRKFLYLLISSTEFIDGRGKRQRSCQQRRKSKRKIIYLSTQLHQPCKLVAVMTVMSRAAVSRRVYFLGRILSLVQIPTKTCIYFVSFNLTDTNVINIIKFKILKVQPSLVESIPFSVFWILQEQIFFW